MLELELLTTLLIISTILSVVSIFSLINYLTNKVKANIYVLRTRVVNLILSQVYRTLAITKYGNMLLLNTQICY